MFSVTFAESSLNCIEVGIIPQEFKLVQNKICDKSIGFLYGTGRVHDTKGEKDKKHTAWRAICEPAKKGDIGTLQVCINTESQLILWMFEGKLLGKSVLTDYLKNKPCVPYISFLNEKDTVILNSNYPAIIT